VSPEQEALINGLDTSKGLNHATLKAWVATRKPAAATPLLDKLAATHPIRIPLAQTVALSLAKKKDLRGAAGVLKRHLEPALVAKGDPRLLSSYYLQIARLLYQAGSLEGAEQFYEKVPNGAPEYFSAREELGWVWLRLGNTERLRGVLTSLRSSLFDDHFAPDVYVLLAISNLKLCYYDETEKSIQSFVEKNGEWAKKISEALKSADPTAPAKKDLWTSIAEKSYEARMKEAGRLEQLEKESIAASLPAVGMQSQWGQYGKEMRALGELVKKKRAQEYRRQWANQQKILGESIQKMRFVRVELMSQVGALAAESKQAKPSAQVATPSAETKIDSSDASMVFPFDGVIWPDELFRLRSAAQAKCLQRSGR